MAETFNVVGIWNSPEDDENHYNEFGRLFQEAGERIQARVRATNFDSTGAMHATGAICITRPAVMEVKSDDMLKFIGSLQYLLGS